MFRSTHSVSIISSAKRFLSIALLLIGCAPRPGGGPELQSRLPRPYDLHAEAANGKATLYWSIDRPTKALISGYNIYVQESGSGIDSSTWKARLPGPYNKTPYPGDIDGDISKESISIASLVDGQTYLALIRTLGPDGKESAPSNVVSLTPLGKGEFQISSDHSAPDGGFNFESRSQVPGRDPRSDIYLYVTEKKIGLSSPSRLSAGFRRTLISTPGDGNSGVETIEIAEGMKLNLEMKRGQADISIEEILGEYPSVSARIKYVFYPKRD